MLKTPRFNLKNIVIVFCLVVTLVFVYLFQRQNIYESVKENSQLLIAQELEYYDQQTVEWANTLTTISQSHQLQQYLKAVLKKRNVSSTTKRLTASFHRYSLNKLDHIYAIRFINNAGRERIASKNGMKTKKPTQFAGTDVYRESKVTPLGKPVKAQFEQANKKLLMHLAMPVGLKNKRMGTLILSIDIESVVNRYQYLQKIKQIDSVVFFNRQGLALFTIGSDSEVTKEAATVYELMKLNNIRNSFLEHEGNIWRYVENEQYDFGILLLTKAENVTKALNIEFLKLGIVLFFVMLLFVFYRSKSSKQILVEDVEEVTKFVTSHRSHNFSIISDEIRHPINTIFGSLVTLSETSLDGLQKEYTQTAKKSAECLFELVNQFQDYSKISRGEFQLDKIEFDLRSTLYDIVELLTPEANKKGLGIACLVGADVPKRVKGDVTRLRQVLMNFVTYAIRNTGSGEVSIAISSEGQNSNEQYINVDISDTGSLTDQETLMQQITQFSKVDFNEEGTCSTEGLGLALSKQLIDLMSGEISSFDNNVGGNTFRIRLPYPVVEVKKSHAFESHLIGKRILIVGEVDSSQQILSQVFTQWELEATTLLDFSRVMYVLRDAYISGKGFDICFIDVSHSSSSDKAFEAATLIRDEFPPSETALIVLTTQGIPGDAIKAKAIGIQAYLTKPIDVKVMRLTINSVVNAMIEASADLLTKHSLRESSRDYLPHVLLLEQGEHQQEALKYHFKRDKFVTDVVTDVNQLEAALKGDAYTAIIINSSFTGLDVLLFVQNYRKEETLLLSQKKLKNKTSLLIMFNHKNDQAEREFRLSGADEVMAYPLIEIDMLEWISQNCSE